MDVARVLLLHHITLLYQFLNAEANTGGAIARVSDLRFTGRGFESCLGTIA